VASRQKIANPKDPGFFKIEARRLSASLEGSDSSSSIGRQVMTGQSQSQ